METSERGISASNIKLNMELTQRCLANRAVHRLPHGADLDQTSRGRSGKHSGCDDGTAGVDDAIRIARQISADRGDFSVFYENVGVLKRAHATHGHDSRIVDSQALSAGADPL